MNINVRGFVVVRGVRLLVIATLLLEVTTASIVELGLDVLPTRNINEAQMLYVN